MKNKRGKNRRKLKKITKPINDNFQMNNDDLFEKEEKDFDQFVCELADKELEKIDEKELANDTELVDIKDLVVEEKVKEKDIALKHKFFNNVNLSKKILNDKFLNLKNQLNLKFDKKDFNLENINLENVKKLFSKKRVFVGAVLISLIGANVLLTLNSSFEKTDNIALSENSKFNVKEQYNFMKSAFENVVSISTYDILVNGKVIVQFDNLSDAKKVLDMLVDLPKGENIKELVYEFDQDVKINKTETKVGDFLGYSTVEDAYNLLKSGSKEVIEYCVVPGDCIEKIAKKFSVKQKDIYDLNAGLDKKKYLQIGDIVKVSAFNPMVTTKVSYTEEYIKTIEPQVVYEETNTLYRGAKSVKTEGVKGEEKVVARVTLRNGSEVSRKVLSKDILKNAEDKVVLVGTKEVKVTQVASRGKVPEGTYAKPTNENIALRGGLKFSSPVSGYVLTSPFGYRWGAFHAGVDLAVKIGTPVYAAESGVVVTSTYNGGEYGHYVRIDHGNGVYTLYAHCSTLVANVGDKVSKGQLIAKSGNTGRSTGPHVHFEVRIDGKAVNPRNYYKF